MNPCLLRKNYSCLECLLVLHYEELGCKIFIPFCKKLTFYALGTNSLQSALEYCFERNVDTAKQDTEIIVSVSWDVALCSQYVNRRFRGTYHLHLQGKKSAVQQVASLLHFSLLLGLFFTLKMEVLRSVGSPTD
jgi:hypothetical protein